MENRFNDRYKTGDLPWDLRKADANLIRMVGKTGIKPCNVIDVGCGTGDNVFWFQQQGFNATGIDYSPEAIRIAQERKNGNEPDVQFDVADILTGPYQNTHYDLVFDRGCFHTFGSDEERTIVAQNIHGMLKSGGHWLSLIGSYDDGRLEIGPPKLKAKQVIDAIEPWFEILHLEQSYFDSTTPDPSKIWICYSRKRKI
ncbi:MAG: class I SAM-dependent methyltransferase [Bacteroidales bacterium]|nr:class I SAM-dependent methyltransferase [Bacteroidales bacterium]